MKRAVLLASFFLSAPAWAQKDDLVAPQKALAPAGKASDKPAPATDKRVLHLQLKK